MPCKKIFKVWTVGGCACLLRTPSQRPQPTARRFKQPEQTAPAMAKCWQRAIFANLLKGTVPRPGERLSSRRRRTSRSPEGSRRALAVLGWKGACLLRPWKIQHPEGLLPAQTPGLSAGLPWGAACASRCYKTFRLFTTFFQTCTGWRVRYAGVGCQPCDCRVLTGKPGPATWSKLEEV